MRRDCAGTDDFIPCALESLGLSFLRDFGERIAVQGRQALPDLDAQRALSAEGFDESGAWTQRIGIREHGAGEGQRSSEGDGLARRILIDLGARARNDEGTPTLERKRQEPGQTQFGADRVQGPTSSKRDQRKRGVHAIESIELHGAGSTPSFRADRALALPLSYGPSRVSVPSSTISGALDQLGRPLRDLRVSVTDRCNFRCTYCMPRASIDEGAFLPRSQLLDFEEIARVARVFVGLGVRKIRLTGGEPLLRRQLPRLVEMLARLDVEVALTTNGVLLSKFARELRDAGLSRVTVSLDALDEAVFQRVCDAPGFSVRDVLGGIEAASAAGFSGVKVNCAVRRGENESEVVPLARYFRGTGHVLRFIEFMDVGTRNGWSHHEVVSAEEIRMALLAVDGLRPLSAQYRGEVAQRYEYEDGAGEVGIIASVTQPFCGDCTRARLSSDGALYSCLFSSHGTPLREVLRAGATDDELTRRVRSWWSERTDRYSEARGLLTEETRATDRDAPGKKLPVVQSRVEMSFIGG